MERLEGLVERLDALFDLSRVPADPSMSRAVPRAYESAGVDWQRSFEPAFATRFNGLMLRGAEEVHTVFCTVFPAPEVLEAFLAQAVPGDLLFSHHPIMMESGDPRGRWGRGFLPIDEAHLRAMQSKRLSFYACHAPLDYSRELGTSAALANALGVEDRQPCAPGTYGDCGVVGTIAPISTDGLIAELRRILHLPYVDLEGPRHERLTRIAVVAGAADRVEWMADAAQKGAQAYVGGEIHCHIDNDYGRQRFAEMLRYAATTPMSLIGVSHAASEYLVMPDQMVPWLRAHCRVETRLLPMRHWWV
ncbi:MAG TPA: Nif3-like dinuclear metal center hexameric protein [Chloroflexota bacterium]|nr:Nif3-like dinuclear metal center hexameric protein [Chloroflexota bacterium]